jgi:hypothetical protein
VRSTHRDNHQPEMSPDSSMFRQMLPIPTPPGSSITLSGCVCMQKAVDILEELEIADGGSNDADICVDQVLSTQKRALGQCSFMLGCGSCSLRSGVVMTLIAVCEKMLHAFERVSRSYQLQQENCDNSPSPAGEDAARLAMLNAKQGTEFAGYLGRYKVDTYKEWRSLISVLIILQLKKLGTLLGKLKTVATQLNWETHLTMVVSFDRRLRDIISNLRRMGLGEGS